VRKLFVLLGLGLIVLASSCETLNIGPGGHIPERFSLLGVTLSPAEPTGGYLAGTTVTATITFQGVTAPFNFTLAFPNGGATPATQTVAGANGTATATFTIDSFLLVDDADGKDIAFTVTGTDGAGSSGSVNGTFHVKGIPNQAPTITTAFNAADCSVTATVSDADAGDNVTITATTVPAALTTPDPQTVAGGNGTATFTFGAAYLLAGGSGTVTFTASDTQASATSDVTVTCDPIVLAADTIYAIPLQTTINAGDRVRIVVATGDPASPFQYLTGTRVTISDTAGALYVGGDAAFGGTADIPGSFNTGAVGGTGVDGFWTAMNPSGFLAAPDNFIRRSDAGGGLHGFDFNVTPLGGSDVTTGSGELFNFELEIPNAGVYQLGFQDVNLVSRTYYQDGNQAPDYFWSDFSNDHAADGVPNTITVN